MKAYNFRNTILLINGIQMVEYADGDDVITFERSVDVAVDQVGAYGTMAVAFSPDLSGTLTFNLQQTSSSNAYLTELVALSQSGLFTPVQVSWKDLEGRDIINVGGDPTSASASKGYIQNLSTMTRGIGLNNQEWRVRLERLDMVVGSPAEL